uniref:Uncharacterized protein n=1 Tax=Anguilla anguilla TaxID=7936 RepID=A0A0E9PTW7_ANGAN
MHHYVQLLALSEIPVIHTRVCSFSINMKNAFKSSTVSDLYVSQKER